jgi:hypothetical protein
MAGMTGIKEYGADSVQPGIGCAESFAGRKMAAMAHRG